MLLGEVAFEHILDALPQFDLHQWLVPSLDELAVPIEPAGAEPVVQDRDGLLLTAGGRCLGWAL